MSGPVQRITIDLGKWCTEGRGDFHLRLVIRSDRLAWIVGQAIKNLDGRTEFGGGAFVLLARRIGVAPVVITVPSEQESA